MAVSVGTMRLTLSIAIAQVTRSVAFMQVLRWKFLLLVCWWVLRVEIIYKLTTRVIQYFCFPNRPMKGGTSWISRKGEILKKKGGGLI